MILFLFFFTALTVSGLDHNLSCDNLPDDPIEFLKKTNQVMNLYYMKGATTSWNWNIDINDENGKISAAAGAETAEARKSLGICAIQKFQSITNQCTTTKSG